MGLWVNESVLCRVDIPPPLEGNDRVDTAGSQLTSSVAQGPRISWSCDRGQGRVIFSSERDLGRLQHGTLLGVSLRDSVSLPVGRMPRERV